MSYENFGSKNWNHNATAPLSTVHITLLPIKWRRNIMELIKNWDNQNQLAKNFQMRYNLYKIKQLEPPNLKVTKKVNKIELFSAPIPDMSVMKNSVDTLLTKWPTCERHGNEIRTSEKQLALECTGCNVLSEYPTSACQGWAADVRVVFTDSSSLRVNKFQDCLVENCVYQE